MIHLLTLMIILCGIIGLYLSKHNNTSLIRRGRQHFKPLFLDKNVMST